MKTEFLKKLGIGEGVIAHIMAENGRDIAREKEKAQTLAQALEEAQKELADAKDALTAREGDAQTIARLTAQRDELLAAEEQRAQQAREKETQDAQRALFRAAAGDRQFLNSYTEEAVFLEFREATEGRGMDPAEAFESLAAREGIFKSQNPPADIPGVQNAAKADYAQFQGLDYAGRVRLYNEDPELYRELKALGEE